MLSERAQVITLLIIHPYGLIVRHIPPHAYDPTNPEDKLRRDKMKINKATTAFFLGSVLLSGAAFATTPVTQNVTANLAFDAPLTITKNSDIDFGLLQAATSATYVITPAGGLSNTGGAYLGGSPHAGNLTIKGSASQVINISTGNYVANNGVTPSVATCAYGTGSAVPCTLTSQAAPTSTGTTLLLGLTASANGSQAAGTTAAPTFDVTVNYN
jgi:uncharacterized protein DUF4402